MENQVRLLFPSFDRSGVMRSEDLQCNVRSTEGRGKGVITTSGDDGNKFG